MAKIPEIRVELLLMSAKILATILAELSTAEL
jgi:hypothetical protein